MTTPQKYLSPMSQKPERWPVLVLDSESYPFIVYDFAEIESIDTCKGWQYIDILPQEPAKTQEQIDYERWKEFSIACKGKPESSEAWFAALKYERSRKPAPQSALDEAAIRADERAKFKKRIMEIWSGPLDLPPMDYYARYLAQDGRHGGADFIRALAAELKEEGRK